MLGWEAFYVCASESRIIFLCGNSSSRLSPT
jgi:hypothetical protein